MPKTPLTRSIKGRKSIEKTCELLPSTVHKARIIYERTKKKSSSIRLSNKYPTLHLYILSVAYWKQVFIHVSPLVGIVFDSRQSFSALLVGNDKRKHPFIKSNAVCISVGQYHHHLIPSLVQLQNKRWSGG